MEATTGQGEALPQTGSFYRKPLSSTPTPHSGTLFAGLSMYQQAPPRAGEVVAATSASRWPSGAPVSVAPPPAETPSASRPPAGPPPAGTPYTGPPPTGTPYPGNHYAGTPYAGFPPPPFAPQGAASFGLLAEKPQPTLADALLAILLIVVGFFCWEWNILSMTYVTGISATLFFLVPVAASCIYLYHKGFRPSRKSLCMLVVVVLGALPFTLNGARSINAALASFELLAALIWVAFTCQTTLRQFLNSLFLVDACRQMFVVPFKNFLRLFAGLGALFHNGHAPGRVRKIVLALVGIVAFIPILLIILALLSHADDGFSMMMNNFWTFIDQLFVENPVRYFVELLFGIPIACYVFGAVYGNYRESHVFRRQISQTAEAAEEWEQAVSAQRLAHTEERIQKLHAIPKVALYTPLACLVAIYVLFFLAMGTYLFSALQGSLPESFTYAEYARRGFFELCDVAFINLLILAFVYLFGRRSRGGYPRALRIFTGLISGLTCLLIATAFSKMFLYIQVYGLTPLRLYTSWFMVVLMVVFLVLVIWHIRPFNAARPLIISVVVLVLALGLTNTDGIIARYNVDRYLEGHTQIIDPGMLGELSDAALPALYDLRNHAPEASVRLQAEESIRIHNYGRSTQTLFQATNEADLWYNWNVQTYGGQQLRATDGL